MYDIMPNKVRGTHAFRASSQSYGAAAAIPSSRGKQKGTNIIDLDDEELVVPKPSTSRLHPIPIPSPSTSKHRCSALDEDDSSISMTSYSSGKRKPCGTAFDGVKESLDVIGTSLRELASERKLRRLQVDARALADAGQEQGGKPQSPQCRHEATQCVQQLETYLDPPRVMALADLVARDTIAADMYMTIEREDYRCAWVALKLKEMGFVDGISI